jgi:hypothetical protein
MRDRDYWVEMLVRITSPVLEALHDRQLRARLPVESLGQGREAYTGLEAFGRTLAGLAPWLETGEKTGEEGQKRERLAVLARSALDAATDPESPDYLNFNEGYQPLVDAAFLAHALIRAPQELWMKLEPRVQFNVAQALKSTRVIRPVFSNWLLFSGIIEAALLRMGEEWDPMRLDYCIRQHEQWYVGDATYGDGPHFHWDYYNSFVIQPMLIDILDIVGDQHQEWKMIREQVMIRGTRYAGVLERMIGADGSFPPLGRSLAYRCGAFQHLAQMALCEKLPSELEPAQVKGALTAVIRKTMDAEGTFDNKGWLTIGLHGHQLQIGEGYISTGSLYLCTTAFLPLGLPASSPFWQGDADWTQKKLWTAVGNLTVPIDKALDD